VPFFFFFKQDKTQDEKARRRSSWTSHTHQQIFGIAEPHRRLRSGRAQSSSKSFAKKGWVYNGHVSSRGQRRKRRLCYFILVERLAREVTALSGGVFLVIPILIAGVCPSPTKGLVLVPVAVSISAPLPTMTTDAAMQDPVLGERRDMSLCWWHFLATLGNQYTGPFLRHGSRDLKSSMREEECRGSREMLLRSCSALPLKRAKTGGGKSLRVWRGRLWRFERRSRSYSVEKGGITRQLRRPEWLPAHHPSCPCRQN
jgi:hypothetical protein